MTWKTIFAGVMLGFIGVACTGFEPICGCTPLTLESRVAGTITDAAGAPVANAPYHIVGVGPGITIELPQNPDNWMWKTDAAGRFAYLVPGFGAEGPMELRVVVFPPGRPRAVVTAGVAPFTYNPPPSDTTKVSIVLPP